MLFIFHGGMDFLKGKLLLHLGGEPISAESKIQDGSLILYYFTSMNCDPCTLFDKELEEVYSQALLKGINMLIIVVPTDDSGDNDKVLNNYPEWYILPFEDDLRWILRYNFGVTHVPQLIVVRTDGEVVTGRGRSEIENMGVNVLITWPQ